MKLSLLSLPSLLAAAVLASRETIDEAAVHTRELIQYRGMNVGVLMSTYPEGDPTGLGGLPIGLQEYYAPYPDGSGDILLLGMGIAKIFRNALPPNAPNMTLTVSDTYGFGDGNLAAGRQRIALFGALEAVRGPREVAKCEAAYLAVHPDARGWIPPGGPHSAFYGRLKVEKVYDFGGFGDVAFIGWIPLGMYRDAGSNMRSAEEVKRDWPVPKQPEQEVGRMTEGEREELFAETRRDRWQDRFRIEW